MKRKEFLKTACGLGLAGSAAALNVKAQTAPAAAEKTRDHFKEAWVKELMESLEKIVDPETRGRLMNACGRACARRGGMMKTAGEI